MKVMIKMIMLLMQTLDHEFSPENQSFLLIINATSSFC